MDIRISGAPTGGRVRAIPSKSAAHRILIAAALSGLDLSPYCDGLSRDITATKNCLQKMMSSSSGQEEGERDALKLACGESGSTLRFLMPLAAALGLKADFYCEGRLPDRPMEPFLQVLEEHGCPVSGRNPKKVRGQLRGGDFHLPGNISSQYVTGLLMALPLLARDSRVIVHGTLQSRPYVDLSLRILAKAGLIIKETTCPSEEESGSRQTIFTIPAGQEYRLPEALLENIEGDWSNAAFFLVMDAMLRDPDREDPLIRCEGLDPDSAQGDKEILSVIRRIRSADEMAARSADEMAARSETSGEPPSGRLDISPAGRGSFVEIDASDIPDLVPIIAALACARPEGAMTHIGNAARLRMKESDRLHSVTETLTALGGAVTEEPAGLMVRGGGLLDGGEVSSFGDHRIVMMAAAASCIAKDDIIIRGAEAVEKSYPGFFEDFRLVGGSWSKIEENEQIQGKAGRIR